MTADGTATARSIVAADRQQAPVTTGAFRPALARETPVWGEVRPDAAGAAVVVLLIDPRAVTRESIAHWLEAHAREFRIHRFAAAADVERFEGSADLVMLNIGAARMTDPAVRQALDALGRLVPGVPLALLAERDDTAGVVEALRRGVQGYLATDLSVGVMIEALRLVRAGGTFVPPAAIFNSLQDRPAPLETDQISKETVIAGFTPRQLQVLDLLRQGKPNKIIAHELDMQQSTVKVHIRHVMTKLSASNRTQAALLANRLFGGGDANIGVRRSWDA